MSFFLGFNYVLLGLISFILWKRQIIIILKILDVSQIWEFFINFNYKILWNNFCSESVCQKFEKKIKSNDTKRNG